MQPNHNLNFDLQPNVHHIRQMLGNSGDLVVRELPVGAKEQLRAAIFYIDGLVDTTLIQNGILEPLMSDLDQDAFQEAIRSDINMLDYLKNHTLAVNHTNVTDTFEGLIQSLLSGNVSFLLDGHNLGLCR